MTWLLLALLFLVPGVAHAVTDNFNRANGALGASWQSNYTGASNGTIVTQKVRATTLSSNMIQVWSTSIGLTQSTQVTLTTFGSGLVGDGAILLRASATPAFTTYYIGASRGTASTYIYRCVAAACAIQAEDTSVTWLQGDSLKATIDAGGTITVFRNGTAFMIFTDPSPLSGTYTGIGMYTGSALTDVELDDFDTVVPTSGTITWTCDRCAITSGSAVGTAPPSLANWIISNLTLASGINTITVIVTDSNGNSSSDTLTVTFTPSFPGNTLAGAWGFAAGSGTTAVDSSGNSNTATFVNTPTWQVSLGRYDSAILFDGINQSLIVNDANSLDFTQSFTISAWVMPSVIHTDYRQIVGKQGSTISDTPPYRLFASADSFTCPATGSGSIAGLLQINGTSGTQFAVCDAPLATGIWTHLAVTYDGTNLKLYRQGALVATTPATGLMDVSTGPLDIATSQFGEAFAGLIDEVRVYNWGIPITAGANTVFGAACNRAAEIATPSVVGDANCSVVAPTSPLSVKIAAAATGFKIKGTVKFGAQ